MNKLGLQHQLSAGHAASMATAALAIVSADVSLYGGSHLVRFPTPLCRAG